MSPSSTHKKSNAASMSSDQALLATASGAVRELTSTELGAWGVDYSSYDLHLGCVSADRTSAYSWAAAGAAPKTPLPERMERLYAAAHRLAFTVATDYPPLAVCVEEPNRSREVIMAHAVIIAAMSKCLRHVMRHPVTIFTVNTSTWRKRVLTHPLDPALNLKAQSVAHVARDFNYATPDHNHADAICIADWLSRSLED